MIKSVRVVTIGVGYGNGQTTKKRYREMVRQSLKEVAEYWHEHFLPRHFEEGASQRYGYQARGKAYLRRKRALAALGRIKKAAPLAFTGEMERMMTRQAKITYSSTRATVTMTGPSYLHSRGRKGTGPQMGEEIKTHTAAERQTLARLAHDALGRQLHADQTLTIEQVA